MSKTNVKVPFARLFGSVTASSLLLTASAGAQGVPCDGSGSIPCGFQIQEVKLQPSPQVFKFQARVSQAKLPIGKGLFDRVIVNLKRGDANLCREEFRDVLVQDSVINLEIGRNMSCEIDQVIAENQNLAFQVCIGGPENCLRPIELASTPYAVKSTFASQAQDAHQADVAAQANYAHRMTADRDLFVTKELGTGYFDFYTPANAPLLYTPSDFETYENGGFLQWTPMNEQSPTLHIVAKNHGSDQIMPLDRLVLGANATETSGRLNVRTGGVHVVGASDVTGNTTVRGQLKVERHAGAGPQGLAVNGNSSITGRLSVTDTVSLGAGGLMCEGPSSFTGQVTAQDIQVNGTLRVNGELAIPGEVNMGGVSSDFSIGGDLVVGGGASITDGLAVAGGMSLLPSPNGNGGTAVAHGASDTLVVNRGGEFAGGTQVQGAMSVQGSLAATGGAAVSGGAIVNGGMYVNGGLTSNQQADFNAGASVTGGLTSHSGATFHNGAAVNGGLTSNNGAVLHNGAVVNGSLTSNNGTTLHAGATIHGGGTINGGAIVNGALTANNGSILRNNVAVTGTLTLNGANVSAVNMNLASGYSAHRDVAGSTTLTMVSTNRSACFLIHANFTDIWEDNDGAACHIYSQNGFWRMNVFVAANGSDSTCEAMCLQW